MASVMHTKMKKCPIITLIIFALIVLSSCLHDDSSPSHIKVFKYDGSVQCDTSAIGLDEMAMELINVGIDVVCSQKGNDGSLRAAVCGAGTGNINIYTINTSNLPDAEALGFESVNTLVDYQDEQCQ